MNNCGVDYLKVVINHLKYFFILPKQRIKLISKIND